MIFFCFTNRRNWSKIINFSRFTYSILLYIVLKVRATQTPFYYFDVSNAVLYHLLEFLRIPQREIFFFFVFSTNSWIHCFLLSSPPNLLLFVYIWEGRTSYQAPLSKWRMGNGQWILKMFGNVWCLYDQIGLKVRVCTYGQIQRSENSWTITMVWIFIFYFENVQIAIRWSC